MSRYIPIYNRPIEPIIAGQDTSGISTETGVLDGGTVLIRSIETIVKTGSLGWTVFG